MNSHSVTKFYIKISYIVIEVWKGKEMYQISVNHTNMLSLFAGLEVYQPFRHQRSVIISIDFEEYKKFIQMVVGTKKRWLYIDNKYYEDALTRKDEYNFLIKLFYFDLARVITDEVIMSINSKKESTLICGTFDTYKEEEKKQVSFSTILPILNCFDTYNKASKIIYNEVKQNLTANTTSNRNLQLIEYAIFLRALSLKDKTELYELRR